MTKIINSVFILHKAINLEIGYKLTSDEFKCKCDYYTCNKIIYSQRLIDSWNLVRGRFGKPLKINSGHRCDRHNEDVGGVDNSKHTQGEAIDISKGNFNDVEVGKLRNLLNEHFDKVIEYPSFFHAHNED